jgi:hypothetical protein
VWFRIALRVAACSLLSLLYVHVSHGVVLRKELDVKHTSSHEMTVLKVHKVLGDVAGMKTTTAKAKVPKPKPEPEPVDKESAACSAKKLVMCAPEEKEIREKDSGDEKHPSDDDCCSSDGSHASFESDGDEAEYMEYLLEKLEGFNSATMATTEFKDDRPKKPRTKTPGLLAHLMGKKKIDLPSEVDAVKHVRMRATNYDLVEEELGPMRFSHSSL